jgi:1-aminocyclopropane-1-carboxylate deaminase
MTLRIQKVQNKLVKEAGLLLFMARADLIHPLASGNKIYKLMPNIEYAKANGYTEILSFGGAFSNYIHALALMANKYGLKSIGIIRGEKEYAKNPTLQEAQAAGMQLEFVNRNDYKRRSDSDYLSNLQKKYPKALIVMLYFFRRTCILSVSFFVNLSMSI